METILGLLLVLLPLVFKLVEKKLKSSGRTDAADKVHEWAEMFGKDDDWDKDEAEDHAPAAVPVQPEVIVRQTEMPKTTVTPKTVSPQSAVHLSPRTGKPSSKHLLEEDAKKKDKEKIDPKKLVVYSEIMKPKF